MPKNQKKRSMSKLMEDLEGIVEQETPQIAAPSEITEIKARQEEINKKLDLLLQQKPPVNSADSTTPNIKEVAARQEAMSQKIEFLMQEKPVPVSPTPEVRSEPILKPGLFGKLTYLMEDRIYLFDLATRKNHITSQLDSSSTLSYFHLSQDNKMVLKTSLLPSEKFTVTSLGQGIFYSFIVDLPRDNLGVAWSPNSKIIAFTPDTSRKVLFADLEKRVETVKSISGKAYNPSWSPNSATLAFELEKAKHDGMSIICTIDRYGLRTQSLTSTEELRNAGHPAWSPDGTKIAFAATEASDTSSGRNIHMMYSDGSNQHNLAGSNDRYDLLPSWSPDGKKIAFYSSCFDNWENTGLYVMNSDGSGLRRLVSMGDPSFNLHHPFPTYPPTWSPDSMGIAFVQRDESSNNAFCKLFVKQINPQAEPELIASGKMIHSIHWSECA